MSINMINSNQSNNIYQNTQNTVSIKDNIKENQFKDGTVYAGNLNIGNDIASKKADAQKNAIRTILKTFQSEQELDKSISNMEDKRTELEAQANQNLSEINRLNDLKEESRETYGVSKDSDEYKNLLILEKDKKGEMLTDEEQEILDNMGELTDYQKEALEYDKSIKEFQSNIDTINEQRFSIGKTINSIKVERLKSHPMLDAKKEAEEIMKEASDEIIQSAFDGVKENENEKLDNIEEKADEKAEEEKEAEQEKLKKDIKEAEQEILTKSTNNNVASLKLQNLKIRQSNIDTYSTSNNLEQVQAQLMQEINEVVDIKNTIPEDLKGILIDGRF